MNGGYFMNYLKITDIEAYNIGFNLSNKVWGYCSLLVIFSSENHWGAIR